MSKKLLLILFICLLGCDTKKAQKQTIATQMQFIKAVKQKGPVAYRDPFGAISPDGKLFAYSDRKQILVQQVVGGATFELEKHGTFVITLNWLPNSQHLVTYEIGGERKFWYIYDLKTKQGTPLWPAKNNFIDESKSINLERADVRDLTWSLDGKRVAGLSKKNGKTQLWLLDENGDNEKIVVEKDLIESIQWNPSSNSFAGIVEENKNRFIQLNLEDTNSEKIKVD
ncbi:MAG TPA: hypothetical protein DIS90_10765, partial [Cytophagales bacterium]|nr:hypothetical protein [Cytophagales bacterium]